MPAAAVRTRARVSDNIHMCCKQDADDGNGDDHVSFVCCGAQRQLLAWLSDVGIVCSSLICCSLCACDVQDAAGDPDQQQVRPRLQSVCVVSVCFLISQPPFVHSMLQEGDSEDDGDGDDDSKGKQVCIFSHIL